MCECVFLQGQEGPFRVGMDFVRSSSLKSVVYGLTILLKELFEVSIYEFYFKFPSSETLNLWPNYLASLDSILKSRDITLPTKVHLVKAMVFPVVMYGCESWTVKKAEH